MPIDDRRNQRGGQSGRRPVRALPWPAAVLALAMLAGAAAGCAGMPPPPPPSALPDDSYSGGSNFGGPPMRFGHQA